MKTSNERVAALRERAAARGLKRREIYAHEDDWPAIKELAVKLQKRREKAVKEECATMKEIDETRRFLTVRRLHATSQEGMEQDAARYRWLRDRMQVHYAVPMSGWKPRAELMMRSGHEFLYSKMHPAAGWTNPRYFDECREKVDAAIDAAMKMDAAR